MRLAGPAARRGPRPVRPLLRRAFPGRLRPEPRDARQRRSSAASLAELIRRVRRNPNSRLADGETLDPEQIAFLITRPKERRPRRRPRSGCGSSAASSAACTPSTTWTSCSATPTCRATARGPSTSTGCCTTACSPTKGLTIHERGLSALVRFISVRAELFRAIYFHRTVRAIDLGAARAVRRQQAVPVPRQSAGAPRRVSAADRVVAVDGGRALAASSRRRRCASWASAGSEFLQPAAALEDGLRADDLLRPRRGRAEQRVQQRDGRSRRPCARPCRGTCRTCRCGSIRPGTSIGPAPTPRRPARTSSTIRSPGKIRSLDDRELFRRIAISYRICRIYAAGQPPQRRTGRRDGPAHRRRRTDDVTNM